MGANLIRTPSAANVFNVASARLPGIATVTGCVDFSKLDVADGNGTKGATVHYHGSSPKAFKVQLHLITEDDYDEWLNGEGRQILLKAPVGTKSKAFAVDHPSCLECNITAALKESVSAAEPVGDGSYIVTISLMPSAEPTPSSGTPNGSQTTSPGNGQQPKTAQSEADKTIADLQNQIKQATQ